MTKITYDGRTFTDADITSGNCYRARSLLSSELSIDTLEFSVEWDDPALADFLMDAPLRLYWDDRLVGTFFVQSIERSSRRVYDFSCISVVGLLDKADHYGGIYTGQTVQEVVTQICAGRALSIAPNIAHIKLYGWLPIAKARENLSQVLFAISATIRVDPAGVLCIEGLADDVTAQIGADRVALDGKVQYDTPVTKVVVTEHQYVQGTEEQNLFEGTTSDGDRITFSEPMHSLAATGFAVKERGDNYAVVSAGSGTLTGKKYVHNTREVIGQAQVRAATNVENVVRVEDATLVSLANARAVADRLAAYYTHTQHIKAEIAYQAEQAGDVVQIMHPYDNAITTACVESLDIALSGRLKAGATALVGYLPPDISQIEYYDTFEILTGSGTWSAPEGVRNLRAVLIEAGAGGQSGTAGADGTRPSRGSTNADGGSGGLGGTAGRGGKIFQVEVTASAGDSFAYACGIGGTAGAYNASAQNPGADGTETTFGMYSSANGANSDIGYTNPFSDVTYAKRGTDGYPGGKGGNARFVDGGYSDAGEDVASWKGGAGGKCYSNGPNQTGDDRSSSGGGGGGAAYGENGVAGTDTRAWVEGNGGNGASAISLSISMLPGQGGNGGNGGGGGGAAGAINAVDGTWIGGVIGTGGSGVAGSPGANGCIILYYSLPKEES